MDGTYSTCKVRVGNTGRGFSARGQWCVRPYNHMGDHKPFHYSEIGRFIPAIYTTLKSNNSTDITLEDIQELFTSVNARHLIHISSKCYFHKFLCLVSV